jgi:hypothetical protein
MIFTDKYSKIFKINDFPRLKKVRLKFHISGFPDSAGTLDYMYLDIVLPPKVYFIACKKNCICAEDVSMTQNIFIKSVYKVEFVLKIHSAAYKFLHFNDNK